MAAITNQSSPIRSQEIVNTPAGTIKSFLEEKKALSAQEVVDCLAQEPELKELFGLFAGVGEGYSVEEHTRMVVESFEKEFLPRADIQDILLNAGLTPQQMMLFLALHDIGKGRAVQKIHYVCSERKELELRYTQEVIDGFSKKWNLGAETQIFLQLLNDDAIGDFLKTCYPSEAVVQETVKVINVAAGNCRAAGLYSLRDTDFLELKTVFHQVDAASYPFLRKRFFQTDSNRTIQLGQSNVRWYLDYSQDNLNKMARLREAMAAPAQLVG